MAQTNGGADPVSPADEAWRLLWVLFESTRGDWVAHLERLGLTEMQAHVLDEIAEHASMPMRAHARRLGVDPSWITDLVDQLERRGDVVRRPSPDDRRVKLVDLTDQGRRTVEDVHSLMGQAPPGLRALPPAQQVDLLRIVRAAVDQQQGRRPGPAS